jgi:probable HAF family extracellular repeat protein
MRASSFKTGPNGEGIWRFDFQATGINDAGVVVGWDFPKQPFTSSWLIYPAAYSGVYDGGTERISGLLSFDSQAELLAVNNSGQAVGVAAGHAVLGSLYYPYTPPGLWTDIGALTGNYYSEAVGINEAGQVIGSYGYGVSHAFITNAGATELTDLGTLGGLGSEALAINDTGQVVGWANTENGAQQAFVTGPNGEGMTDLNSLVHLSEGVVLTTAMGINNKGQVIVLAIPEPETYALMLAGLGLIGFVAQRQKPGSRI